MIMRNIMITGASSDIGLACVNLSLSEGHIVHAVYRRNSDELNSLKEKYSANLKLLKVDFSTKSQVEILLNEINAQKERIDSYIGLAAVRENIEYNKINYDDLIKHFKVNVIPHVLIVRSLGEIMFKNKWGRIVIGSSIGVKFGGGKYSYCYSLTKYASELVPNIAKKWAKNNVLYNVVRIGITDTKRMRNDGENKLRKRAGMVPMQRPASPAEIANLLYWLSSDQNTYITGETISISGGE